MRNKSIFQFLNCSHYRHIIPHSWHLIQKYKFKNCICYISEQEISGLVPSLSRSTINQQNDLWTQHRQHHLPCLIKVCAVCMKKPWVLSNTAKTDQAGWMPGLIWVFAGCTDVILLVLSCSVSIYICYSVDYVQLYTINVPFLDNNLTISERRKYKTQYLINMFCRNLIFYYIRGNISLQIWPHHSCTYILLA